MSCGVEVLALACRDLFLLNGQALDPFLFGLVGRVVVRARRDGDRLALDPSGRWLIVSNQEGGNLAVFAVDAKSGELAPKGEPVPLAKP